MFIPTLRLNDKNKFVRQIKKYLNELVQPSPNLPDDDVFDEKTVKAIAEFKKQWAVKTKHTFNQLDGKYQADIFTWSFIGMALGVDRLKKELAVVRDHELRTLLLGMSAFAEGVSYYTAESEICDSKIAKILGGKNAIAAANGFEPEGIALILNSKLKPMVSFYRGDTFRLLKDGTKVIGQGHLSRYIMHLYGSTDGTRLGTDGKTSTDIYIPDGFEMISSGDTGGKKDALKQIPTPTQAVVTFYYKQLGNVKDATLLLMHVKDFKPKKDGNRWHIGKIGGIGGQLDPLNQPYLHSHFMLLKGDVGLALKVDRSDPFATSNYRASIGIRFIDAFC